MGERGCQGDSALDISAQTYPLLSYVRLLSRSRRRKAADSEGLGHWFLLCVSFQGEGVGCESLQPYTFRRLKFLQRKEFS